MQVNEHTALHWHLVEKFLEDAQKKKKYAPVCYPQLRLFLEHIYTELIKPQDLTVNLAPCLIWRALLKERYQWPS